MSAKSWADSVSSVPEFLGISRMEEIDWDDFARVELRVGTIVEVEDFPEARKPAWKLMVDFGPEIGLKKSSAQITYLYGKNELIGKQVLGVVNFPPKQIGPVRSECLITGFIRDDGAVVLAVPDKPVANGLKLA
jgi:tRNA-binding protein